jgi:hypothetical protein
LKCSFFCSTPVFGIPNVCLPWQAVTCLMPQLDAIKTQCPGDALWTALQFEPPTGNNMTPLEQQQLRVLQMDLMLAEQQARNAVKGFWNGTLRAMQEVTQIIVWH